jgi:hypothetical protein
MIHVIGNSFLSLRRTWFVAATAFWVALAWLPSSAWAMTGPWVDTAANVLAIVVLLIVPAAAIYLFWMVHILPEKIAEKRHHPQKDAIKTLCLLSLVFGGMLWPFAWIWAYTKPVLHKVAYGTDKHEDYYLENPQEVVADDALARLRRTIGKLEAKGGSAPQIEALKRELAEIEHALSLTRRSQEGS